MFLTAHATVGALLGQSIANPWIAFLFGFISHFAVDLIPHGDQSLIGEGTHKQKMVKLIAITALDLTILGIITAFWFFGESRTFISPLSVLAGMFGAMLPDGLQGITEFSNGRCLARFKHLHDQFHVHTHTHLHRFVVPFAIGLPIQIVFWYIVQSRVGL